MRLGSRRADVGKSTLNAITKAGAEAVNYPLYHRAECGDCTCTGREIRCVGKMYNPERLRMHL